MASISLIPISSVSVKHSIEPTSSTAHAVLSDNSNSTYIYQTLKESSASLTSSIILGTTGNLPTRFVVSSIVIDTTNYRINANAFKSGDNKGQLKVNNSSGTSWTNTLSTSYTNRSHTSNASEFSSINNKVLTELPSIEYGITTSGSLSKDGTVTINISKVSGTLNYTPYWEQIIGGSTTGITASVSNGNQVDGYYKDGTNTTWTAVPDQSHRFKGWYANSSHTGTPVSTSATYTAVCNSDTTLYAYGVQIYTITVDGIHSSTTGGGTYEEGSSVTVTSTPEAHYHFKGWYENSSGTGTPVSTNTTYTFTPSSDKTLYSICEANTYTTNVVGINCRVSQPKYTTTYPNTISPEYQIEAGIRFVKWNTKSDGSGTDITMPYQPTSNNTIYAIAEYIEYNITVTGTPDCTVEKEHSDNHYNTPVKFTCTIPEPDDYKFLGWYSDSGRTQLLSMDNPYNTVIQSNMDVYAKTAEKYTFKIKYNNTIVKADNVYKKQGGSWVRMRPSNYESIKELTDIVVIEDNN